VELEHLLHCDGIWLHALRYTGPPLKKERAPAAENVKTGEVAVEANSTTSAADVSLRVERVPRRWAFQAPYPAWASPFAAK